MPGALHFSSLCKPGGRTGRQRGNNERRRERDFLAMESEIDKYCIKNRIPWKTAHHIHLAFEEMIQQLLIPVLEQPDIRAAIE